jgi:hypothetical protein
MKHIKRTIIGMLIGALGVALANYAPSTSDVADVTVCAD